MSAVVTLIVVGVVLAAVGAAAYAGLWHRVTRGHGTPMPFGLLWLGIASLSLGLAALCFDGPVVLALVLLTVFALGVVLGVWIVIGGARWATPRWARRRVER